MKPIVPFIHSLTAERANAWIQSLRLSMPGFEISQLEALSERDRNQVKVAIVANPVPNHLRVLPNIEWIQSLWTGVERLLDELKEDDIAIVRLIDPQLANTMAEAVLAWSLYLHRDMPKYSAQQAQQIWVQHDIKRASERTIAVLGLGQLGKTAAERLHQNGFRVMGWSRSAKQLTGVETVYGQKGLSQIAKQADILVVLLPSTPYTRGVLNHQFFGQAKFGVSLINFARADIINSQAFNKNLKTGKIEHAVLDVFESEPLAKGHPFWSNDRVTVLPHISAPTNLQTASKIVAANIQRYFSNNIIPESISRVDGY